jgi:hypothetical protein
MLLGLARAITLGSKSRRTYGHILLSHLRLPQPGGPGSRIYISQEQGGPVIPRALGSLFVASYDSRGYGGGILTRLHTGQQGTKTRKRELTSGDIYRLVPTTSQYTAQRLSTYAHTDQQPSQCICGIANELLIILSTFLFSSAYVDGINE